MVKELELPSFLKMTAEQRKEAWEKNPPKPRSTSIERPVAKEDEVARQKLIEENEELKRARSARKAAARKQASERVPGAVWNTTFSRWVHPQEERPTMMSITTNTRGKTPMKSPKEMSGPELVAAYNVLAPRVGASPIAKFKDLKTGIRRLEELRKQKSAPSATEKSPPSDARGKMLFAFGVREGTNREKVLGALWENKGKATPRKVLLKAVYGNVSDENVGALSMVLKGLVDKIKTGKLPYAIDKGKTEDKEVTYAFSAK